MLLCDITRGKSNVEICHGHVNDQDYGHSDSPGSYQRHLSFIQLMPTIQITPIACDREGPGFTVWTDGESAHILWNWATYIVAYVPITRLTLSFLQ